VNSVTALTAKKMLFVQKVSETQSRISEAFNQIASDYRASESLNEELSNTIDGLRPETVEAAKGMARNARVRLLKYQYLMAKAYEYEMVAPYPGDLQLQQLFDHVTRLVDEGNDPSWLDDPAKFESLGALFHSGLSDIANLIWNNLNSGVPTLTSTLILSLSAEQLDELNRNDKLELDLVLLGIVDPSWEDARILDVRVGNIDSSIRSPSPQSANVRLEFAQPANSVIQRDGHRFLFVHPEDAAGAARWASDYDAVSDSITHATISPRHLAALAAMLRLDPTSIDSDFVSRFYSSPSARSTLELRKYETPATMDVDLEAITLVIRLEYQRPVSTSKLLEVRVNGDFSPRIHVAQSDLAGHNDGLGSFSRHFTTGETVEVTAQPGYGQLKFVEWRDHSGMVIGRSNNASIRLDESARIQAIYAVLGDSDFNGTFDSSDLVKVFQAGEYEDAIVGNSSFHEGDWNGDGDFDSSDILAAFQAGAFHNGV
jgi:hypothetical protein